MSKAARKVVSPLDADLFKIFQQLKHELYKWDVQSVAEDAGIAPATIYFWMNGTTNYPRLDTISRVADAIGFEIRMTRVKGAKKNHLRSVK